MLNESAAMSDRITHSAVFEPWSHVETTSRSQVVADVRGCVSEALDRRRLLKDSQEQWYCGGWNQAVIRGVSIAIRCEDF